MRVKPSRLTLSGSQTRFIESAHILLDYTSRGLGGCLVIFRPGGVCERRHFHFLSRPGKDLPKVGLSRLGAHNAVGEADLLFGRHFWLYSVRSVAMRLHLESPPGLFTQL
jgi:hypothetical protein